MLSLSKQTLRLCVRATHSASSETDNNNKNKNARPILYKHARPILYKQAQSHVVKIRSIYSAAEFPQEKRPPATQPIQHTAYSILWHYHIIIIRLAIRHLIDNVRHELSR